MTFLNKATAGSPLVVLSLVLILLLLPVPSASSLQHCSILFALDEFPNARRCSGVFAGMNSENHLACNQSSVHLWQKRKQQAEAGEEYHPEKDPIQIVIEYASSTPEEVSVQLSECVEEITVTYANQPPPSTVSGTPWPHSRKGLSIQAVLDLPSVSSVSYEACLEALGRDLKPFFVPSSKESSSSLPLIVDPARFAVVRREETADGRVRRAEVLLYVPFTAPGVWEHEEKCPREKKKRTYACFELDTKAFLPGDPSAQKILQGMVTDEWEGLPMGADVVMMEMRVGRDGVVSDAQQRKDKGALKVHVRHAGLTSGDIPAEFLIPEEEGGGIQGSPPCQHYMLAHTGKSVELLRVNEIGDEDKVLAWNGVSMNFEFYNDMDIRAPSEVFFGLQRSIRNQGFHKVLHTDLHLLRPMDPGSGQCRLWVQEYLDSTVYIDNYEMAQKIQPSQKMTCPVPIDVEKPSQISRHYVVEFDIEFKEWTSFDIPIHTRYQPPIEDFFFSALPIHGKEISPTHRLAFIYPPNVRLECSGYKGRANVATMVDSWKRCVDENPKNAELGSILLCMHDTGERVVHLEYEDNIVPKELFKDVVLAKEDEALTFLQKEEKTFLLVPVPVGRISDQGIVRYATLSVTLLGAIVIAILVCKKYSNAKDTEKNLKTKKEQ
eukprot:Nk52_evm50s153 gene=Nk52_evmTU50s153